MPRVNMLTDHADEPRRNEFTDSIPSAEAAGYWTRTGRRSAKRNRRWEREHRPYRYVNVPLEVRQQVLALARHLLVTADEAARALIEYSVECADEETLQIHARPNPLGRKMTLFPKQEEKRWKSTNGTAKVIPAGRTKSSPAKKRTAGAVSYRLPRSVHDDICDFAMEHDVPLGEIVTLFLRHGLKAYQAGRLELDPQPKIVRMTLLAGSHAADE